MDLNLSYINLIEIPNNLSRILIKLNISWNQITEIKNLPDSLQELHIYNNLK
jgi:hypothetical protein